MGRRVWKYTIGLGISTRVPVGASAKVVFTAIQRNNLVIWFEMRDDDPVVQPRIFIVAITGEDLSPNMEHVASVMTLDGSYVWHVYEVVR